MLCLQKQENSPQWSPFPSHLYFPSVDLHVNAHCQHSKVCFQGNREIGNGLRRYLPLIKPSFVALQGRRAFGVSLLEWGYLPTGWLDDTNLLSVTQHKSLRAVFWCFSINSTALFAFRKRRFNVYQLIPKMRCWFVERFSTSYLKLKHTGQLNNSHLQCGRKLHYEKAFWTPIVRLYRTCSRVSVWSVLEIRWELRKWIPINFELNCFRNSARNYLFFVDTLLETGC